MIEDDDAADGDELRCRRCADRPIERPIDRRELAAVLAPALAGGPG